MKRLALALAFAFVTLGAAAAGPKIPLEIWGLEGADEVRIDDKPATVRGGEARPFLGDPGADNAPVLTELPAGKHSVVVLRAGCAPEAFEVTLEGTQKAAVVMGKGEPSRCALPELPERRD